MSYLNPDIRVLGTDIHAARTFSPNSILELDEGILTRKIA